MNQDQFPADMNQEQWEAAMQLLRTQACLERSLTDDQKPLFFDMLVAQDQLEQTLRGKSSPNAWRSNIIAQQ